MALIAANGSLLDGGRRQTRLPICFTTDEPNKFTGQCEFCAWATFLEAEISVDMILSYPWLETVRIGTFTHLSALARYDPNDGGTEPVLDFLSSWTPERVRAYRNLLRVNKALHMVRSLNLELPPEAHEERGQSLFEDEETLGHLSFVLSSIFDPVPVRSVVQIPPNFRWIRNGMQQKRKWAKLLPRCTNILTRW